MMLSVRRNEGNAETVQVKYFIGTALNAEVSREVNNMKYKKFEAVSM